MKLVFVHGWSVTHTDTYGELPEALCAAAPDDLELDIAHAHLGRYISFHDEVTVADIARAFEQARRDLFGSGPFSCITHSTGGPVIREWIRRYYGGKGKLKRLPLRHLVMLAPANHGSALAQLGKARVGRIKAWWAGVEPGQGVLDWLELGSRGQRDLNLAWLDYDPPARELYPVVITGESIDNKLYDYLNSYTGEAGSDGVVRVAAANLNYRHITLRQDLDAPPYSYQDGDEQRLAHRLLLHDGEARTAPPCALEVLPDCSHSGEKMGIMRSVKADHDRDRPVVAAVLDSLQVGSAEEYRILSDEMANRTDRVQGKYQYAMVVVRVCDDQGNEVQDYDLFLLAGDDYRPDKLPKGFFVDKQKNRVNRNQLTYYLNASRMARIRNGKLGFRVVARPDAGFAHYTPAEFRSDDLQVTDLIRDNQTLLLDVVLKRNVDVNTFRFGPATDPRDGDQGNFRTHVPARRNVT